MVQRERGRYNMYISYEGLFKIMEERGVKKIDLRETGGKDRKLPEGFKLNPKTVNALAHNQSVTVSTLLSICEAFGLKDIGQIIKLVDEEPENH